jgi:hypothetical protein
VLGLSNAEDILTMPWGELRDRTQSLLGELGVPPSTYPNSQPQRALFTNRTLNLRSIQAIGYDMGAPRAQPRAQPACSRRSLADASSPSAGVLAVAVLGWPGFGACCDRTAGSARSLPSPPLLQTTP